MNLKPINKLNPFTKFCCTIGNLPSSYLDSMTYYEQLLWFCNFLEKTVIPSINTNAEAVQELQNLLVELKNYVDNYFENLDVQEEINNKLDEMAENGTLEAIVGNYLDFDIQDLLNFRKLLDFDIDETVLHNGVSHSQLQGFTKVDENKIVLALINKNKQDNDVLLMEYNISTKEIIRSSYLQLYHANSIAYDSTNRLLYVSALGTANNGSLSDNNSIIVVDYDTFTITNTINLVNIPYGSKIRSVYYDNTNNILYAGDVTTVFKIDIANSSIVEQINLETNNINTLITNQNMKVYKKWFVSLFNNFLVFWKKNGKIMRIINVEQYNEGDKDGEVEDIFIDETTGNILLGSYKKDNTITKYMNIIFSSSNIYTNNSNVLPLNLGGIDTTPISIYVNNTYTGEENGTKNHPYRSLQKACNMIRNIPYKPVRIYLDGDTQEYCDIRGITASIVCRTDILIKGLDILYSKIVFNFENNAHVTVKGIYCYFSELFISDPNTYFTVTKIENSLSSSAIGNCIRANFSKLFLEKINFTGDNTNSLVDLRQNTNATFNNCVFSNYTSYYALRVLSVSNARLYYNTFNTTDQAFIDVGYYGIVETQKELNKLSYYNVGNRGLVKNAFLQDDTVTNTYFGTVCSINTNYNMMRVEIATGGSANTTKYIDIPTTMTSFLAETLWTNNIAFKYNLLRLYKNNNNLEIETHRYVSIPMNGDAPTYEDLTSESEFTSNHAYIKSVSYYNI